MHLLVPGWTFTGLRVGRKTKEKPEGAGAPEQVTEYVAKKVGRGEGLCYLHESRKS